jgi:hypothetical protein
MAHRENQPENGRTNTYGMQSNVQGTDEHQDYETGTSEANGVYLTRKIEGDSLKANDLMLWRRRDCSKR